MLPGPVYRGTDSEILRKESILSTDVVLGWGVLKRIPFNPRDTISASY
tara:strand:- start:105 stop:248 length:144 start_codon:yes stop_codon:yes gene_type:complete